MRKAALAVAACTLFFASCARVTKVEAEAVEAAPVAKVTRQDLARELKLAAEFRPYQEIELHAKVAGYLKEIYVDVGDRVKQGQLLAVLEIPEMTEDLAQASAAEKRSEAEVVRARGELERAESAHANAHLSYTRLAAVIRSRPNLVAQQEIDDAMARDRVSEAQISAAKAALTAAEQQVQVSQASESRVKTMALYSRITAPFNGVITKRYADTGAMIQAGTASQTQTMPVVRLSQNDRLRLVLPVPESISPRIHIGGPVNVQVGALNRRFEGRVARFTGRVQEATRTMETEVDVPNPELVLLPGMYAEATLTLDRRPDVLAIPVQAISGDTTNASALVVNDRSQLEERHVTLGIETPTLVEVLAGLKENELVVIGSRSQFKPGQPVEPKLVQLAGLGQGR